MSNSGPYAAGRGIPEAGAGEGRDKERVQLGGRGDDEQVLCGLGKQEARVLGEWGGGAKEKGRRELRCRGCSEKPPRR